MRFIKEIFRGDAPLSQKFGENPDIYSPMGLKGHNGIDFATAIGTDIFAGVMGNVTKVEDQGDIGYGKSIVVVTHVNGRHFELRWAHLYSLEKNISVGSYMFPERVMGQTGNSGFCVTKGHKVTPQERNLGLGAHLHFQVRELDESGMVINYLNGYKGAIDPLPLFDL